ncbi:hypothetical protein BD324DRAFT_619807 [Kockovaella imperatae]|uniref:Uncharacterized protein n=1 Tax=Kockovaella imperatae TaxID=4999 RepID=A0A1Y1UJD2_9TREE|nr:hypothetical protein BD324DRAFT_619807 [Kockovaella imperatae]ORX38161.1 hypothetical protein BD324DRAFT_619807 [Kockovaella imperatae]
MSSLPPRQPTADPHTLTHLQNAKQATQTVNRFAKRDPALFPLSIIMCLALGGAGYFFTRKASEPEPHRQLMANGVINPWDDQSKHDTHPSAVAAFKYRHKNRDGVYEDSLPALNTEVANLKNEAKFKFRSA